MSELKHQPSMKALLNQFHGTLEGVRELLQFVVPKLVERHVERQSFEGLVTRAGLVGDELHEAVATWDAEVELRFAQLKQDASEADNSVNDEDVEDDEDDAETAMHRQLLRLRAERASMLADGVTEYLSKKGVLSAFVHHLNRERTKLPDIETIHRSAITMAVGAFEALVGGIVANYLRTHPQALGGDEPEFSIGDLIRLGSLDAATDEAIERRVERFLYQGFDQWADAFQKRLKIDWKELAIDWDDTKEIIQRRHIIVHNGARVSRQYLERVPDRFKDVPVGRMLFHPPEYVARALALLTGLGDAIAGHAWAQLDKSESSAAAEALLNKSFDLLVAENYVAVHHVAHVGAQLDADAIVTMSLKCNRWIAEKQAAGVDAIRAAVSEWDTSATSLKFRVAKAALLDDLDELSSILPTCLEAGELSIEDVKFWPLFKELRDEALFVELLEQYGTDLSQNGPA